MTRSDQALVLLLRFVGVTALQRGPSDTGALYWGTRLNRHDFGASWNSPLENAGLVVGSEVFITVDVEAILESELNPILGRTSSS